MPVGEAIFQRFVRRASDARLERTLGSDRGLRFVFRADGEGLPARSRRRVEWRHPLRAGRLARRRADLDGHLRPREAHAREVAAPSPDLTVKVGVADFIRVAGRDLDPAKALLTGRMDLEGDFAVATRLG